MTSQQDKREIADRILRSIEERYGFVPLVNQVLSEKPELFIPAANLAKEAFESDSKSLDRRTSYLCAVAAAAAIGGEHCMRVQGSHAKAEGVTREEMLEAMFIGSFMAMTRSEGVSFRVLNELYEKE